MYLLNNKPLSLDRAFTTEDGTQYPANWLRLSTPEQRAAIGITEAPSEPSYDQRFYWGPGLPKHLEDEPVLDEEGNPTDQIQTGLKTQYKANQKEIAQSLLQGTDWVVVRAAEYPNKPVPEDLTTYRAAVRSVSSAREDEIDVVTTVEELIELLNGQPTIYDPELDQQVTNPGLFLTPWPDDIPR